MHSVLLAIDYRLLNGQKDCLQKLGASRQYTIFSEETRFEKMGLLVEENPGGGARQVA